MKHYLKKTIDYAAGNFFNKVLLILLLPIFTHFLLPQEFAVYTNLMIFFSFASLIYLLGIHQAIFSHFYDVKTVEYQFSLISSIYVILTVFGFALSILIILLRNELSLLVLRSTDYSHLFYYIAIILFFNMLFSISLSLMNIMERSRQYAIISALQNVIVLLLIILFSINNKFSVEYYFIFLAIASVIASFVGIIQIIKIVKNFQVPKKEKKYFSSAIVSSMLKFGIVMIPGTISMLILQASDRYMLTYLSANTMHDVGIYSAGYRIGMIMHFLVTMISLVYLPYAMKIAKEPQAQSINRSMFKYFVIFGSLFGSLIIIYSQEIFRYIIDSNYITSYKIVFAGVISSFLYGIFNIININYYARKKAGNITLAVILGSIINIALNFFLIPKYGIFGAGIASIISYLFIVIFNYFIAAHLYKFRYPVLLIFVGLIILSSATLFNNYLQLNLELFIIKTIVVIGILGTAFLISKKDKQIQKLINILKEDRKK
ncbi:MAG: oligosaccharide flippase family protein [Candidatus Cloacimonetes bacterium]|nr:oligosaccharide flippase family protein [Candidatus Cloacimonadota bacterium]